MTTPGERIQQLLNEKHITQRRLAADLHLNPNTINGYIHNRRSPDLVTAAQIANYLGTSIDYLFGNTTIKYYPQLDLTEEEGWLLGNYRAISEDHRRLLISFSSLLAKASPCLPDEHFPNIHP